MNIALKQDNLFYLTKFLQSSNDVVIKNLDNKTYE